MLGESYRPFIQSIRFLRISGSSSFSVLALVVILLVSAGPAWSVGQCPNAALRGGASAHLPDCRAYELVTPTEKNGGYINRGSFLTSPEGQSVGFTSISGFANATSTIYTQTSYQASRSATGGQPAWNTVADTEPESQFIDSHALLSTDFLDETFGDLSTLSKSEYSLESGLRLWRLQEVSGPESSLAFYLTGSDGVNVKVGPAVPSTASGLAQSRQNKLESEELQVVGMSADASHMVYTDPEPAGPNQWPFSAPGALLEYTGTGNSQPMLVGIGNDGAFVNNCPHQLLGGTSTFNNVANPISSDGSRIFFTDQCRGQLFARVDNGEATQHTVEISEPSSAACPKCNTDPATQRGAVFLGASEDGSKVFFYTEQPLLNGSGGLYEYNFNSLPGRPVVTQISPGPLPALNDSQTVGGTRIVISPDGSHVYFLSNLVLTEAPAPDVQGLDNAGHPVTSEAVAQPGGDNLYDYEQDTTYPDGHIAFVAPINPSDTASSEEAAFNTTPDGRILVLNVRSDLTSDDTSSAAQVFEYNSAADSMVRVSHGEGGYNDNGNGAVASATIAVAGKEESRFDPSSYYEHLTVSANGEYVYFQSPYALTPDALNLVPVGLVFGGSGAGEPAYAENVYEYHTGHVYLVSDGQDLSSHNVSQVHLLGTDMSGRDLFFETTDQLVPQDTDSNKDIYDARVEGGIVPLPAPPSCSGDSCQGQLNPAPVLLSPGSEFQAGGNLPLPAAKRGSARKHTVKAKVKVKKRAPHARKPRAKSPSHGKSLSHKGKFPHPR
jgi:hypothetical protein